MKAKLLGEFAGEVTAARLAFPADEIAPASRHLRDRSSADRSAHGLWDDMEDKALGLAGLLSRLVEDVISSAHRPATAPIPREAAEIL